MKFTLSVFDQKTFCLFFICFRSFLGEFVQKNQNCRFKMKFSTQTNSNIQKLIVNFTFSVFNQEYPFLEKCCPKNKYYQFKLKFCTKPYSNMHNSMVMIISCFLDRKCSNLLQKIKIKIVRPATLLKKRLWNRCFPVNFAKFLRTPFYRTPLVNCFQLVQLCVIKIYQTTRLRLNV